VSRSAYYRWKRGASYQLTLQQQDKLTLVKAVFVEHKRRYGSRRIVAELQDKGHVIGRQQVRTLMKEADLQAIQPKSFVPRTTNSNHDKGYWPNLLLDLEFPVAPNRVWVSDITYLPLPNGKWAYLGAWMDLFSRRVVGWRVDDNMEDDLILIPLRNALRSRLPSAGLIVHSDRGGQYISNEYKELVDVWRINPSMSRPDDPYDNAFAESFWSRLKAELLEGGLFLSVEDARTEVFAYIEGYYNRVRRHSSLGYKSPEKYELEYELKQATSVCR
jgi:putative transposase